MSLVDKIWYEKSPSAWLLSLPLRPFSWIFAFVSAFRRMLYRNGILKSSAPLVPVVVVGGLAAGGSGKTPLCIALIRELQRRGYNPGLVSRGYKSRCRTFPFQLTDESPAEQCGDEPYLIRHETGAEVVIDPKRERGAQFLADLGVDVIISDDGLQHYSMDRDVEIAVVDGARMFGNRLMLPAGPLREGLWRLKSVNTVVINGAVSKIGRNTMMLHPQPPQPIDREEPRVLPRGSRVIALAGIGNPDRFYKTLEDCGYTIDSVLHVSDHGRMAVEKIRAAAAVTPVVMTAKDAVKYDGRGMPNVFVLNVEAFLSPSFYDDVEKLIKSAHSRIELRAARQRRQSK